MPDNTSLSPSDLSHWRAVQKYEHKTGDQRASEAMVHWWKSGDALIRIREGLPARTFSSWLDTHKIDRGTAYSHIFLTENYTEEEAKALRSLRQAKRLAVGEDEDNLSVQRDKQIDSDITTETSVLHENSPGSESVLHEEGTESEWWDGFDADDPAVTTADPIPEPPPELPVDEVVWEDKREQTEVLEPEEKVERLTRTDKLELRMDELETQNAELREANTDLASDNEDLQGQIRNFLNEDGHDTMRHKEVVRLQARVSILNGQYHQTAMKLKDAKGELRKSKSSVKSLLKERDSLRQRLGIAA